MARDRWQPDRPIEYPRVLVWPPDPRGTFRWLFGFPGFLAPWTLAYVGLAALVWHVATPDLESMRSLSLGWIASVLVRNLVLTLAWFGGFHHLLYRRRTQGTEFKYDQRWPAANSRRHSLGSQFRDNLLWSLASGVPIWTAWECLTLWLAANGRLPMHEWATHPVWFVALVFLVPIFREIHFYVVHRAIHHPRVYKRVHALHHRNTNPSPFSGLSMHPIEHLLYFSGVLLHWVLPSHPFHATYHLLHAGLSPAPGHLGFHAIRVGSAKMPTDYYAHYLHHTLFEVNYADGVIPLDKWFGTFHDGTPEADARTLTRRKARVAALAPGSEA